MDDAENLANRILLQAEQHDLVALAGTFSSLPLGTLLSLRTRLLTGGGYAAVVEALIEGLRHPDPPVRYNCANALDHFADERCAEPLRRLLDDPVPRVRRMALHALSCEACKLGPIATGEDFVALAIRQTTSDPSINVRRHAVSELSVRRNDARAAEILQRLAESETDPAILRYARRAG